MIDRIVYRPHRLFLDPKKVKELQGMSKVWFQVVSYHAHGTARFDVVVEGRRVASIHVLVLQDGRWFVKHVTAVIPSLLYGSNGVMVRCPCKLALALTILDHLIGLVRDRNTGYTLPGVGEGNRGYICQVEVGVQILDEERRFLRASHHARLSKQRKATGIFIGESTFCSTRTMKFAAYNKNTQLYERDRTDEAEEEATKVEIVYKTSKELGDAFHALVGKRGTEKAGSKRSALQQPVPASISLGDAYKLFKKGMGRVSGIGWIPKNADLQEITHRKARLLAMGLGDNVRDPLEVARALSHFKAENRCRNTYRDVEMALRGCAMEQVGGDFKSMITADPADIRWADVPWTSRQHEWQRLLDTVGAPTKPDPDIAAAWGQSQVLPTTPHFMDLSGPIAPDQLPFLQKHFSL